MDKPRKTPYEDPQRFVAEFKMRQDEMKDGLSLWSDGMEFSSKVKKIAQDNLKDHDEIKALATRLVEHHAFTSKIEAMVITMIKREHVNTWYERWKITIWCIFTALVTTVVNTLCSKFVK